MSALTPLAILTIVHLVGLVALVWMALATEDQRDDGGEGLSDGQGGLPKPSPRPPTGGPPLPDATPARVRLRHPSPLGAIAPLARGRRGPAERPSTPPAPTPTRQPCADKGGRRP